MLLSQETIQTTNDK